MRNYLIITLVLLCFGFSQNKVNVNNIVKYGDKWFKENDDRPFSGIVFDMDKETGNKILEYYISHGKKKGRYKKWDKSGVLLINGFYKDDLMNGEWKFYHSNGLKLGSGKFVNGDGSNKSELTNISKNGREGNWKFWYQNGQVMEKSFYMNGKLFDLSTIWYENGQKKEESIFKNNKLNGYSHFWFKNGQKEKEGSWIDGKQEGLWTYWYENGQKKSEGEYENSTKVGLWVEWNEYGENRMEYNYGYLNTKETTNIRTKDTLSYQIGLPIPGWETIIGKREGSWVYRYENGKKEKEGSWIDGKQEGIWTYWYENGKKEKEGSWIDGKQEGLWTYWYENGKKGKTYYKDNMLHGSYKKFNINDEIIYHVIYINEIIEVFVFGDFYRPETHPKWESSIDESIKYLKDFFNEGMITEEEYKSFKIDLLKDEKYWNKDGSVKE